MDDSSFALPMSAVLAAVLAAVVVVALAVWTAAALAALFRKLGESGWKAWVPFLNAAVLLRLGGMSGWLLLLLLIPVFGQVFVYVAIVTAAHRVNQAFGAGGGMTLLAALLFPVWASVLGWNGAVPELWRDADSPAGTTTREDEAAFRGLFDLAPAARGDEGFAHRRAVSVPSEWIPPLGEPRGEPAPGRNGDASAPRTSVFASAGTLHPFVAQPASTGADVPDGIGPDGIGPDAIDPETNDRDVIGQVAAPGHAPMSDTAPVGGLAAPVASAAVPAPVPEPEPALTKQQPTSWWMPGEPPAATPSGDADGDLLRPGAGHADRGRPEPDIDEPDDSTVISSRRRPRWVLDLPDAGGAVELTGEAVVLGRSPLPVDEVPGAQLVAVREGTRTVSKTHAVLRRGSAGWTIGDLGSTNGVVLDPDGAARELEPGETAPVTGRFLLGDAVVVLRERD